MALATTCLTKLHNKRYQHGYGAVPPLAIPVNQKLHRRIAGVLTQTDDYTEVKATYDCNYCCRKSRAAACRASA